MAISVNTIDPVLPRQMLEDADSAAEAHLAFVRALQDLQDGKVEMTSHREDETLTFTWRRT